MNTSFLKAGLVTVCALGLVPFAGCNRQTRGNADADTQSQAAAPADGGSTSTAGSAGAAKNFGDTRAKTLEEGQSPSASPTGLSKDAKAGDTGGAINPPTATPSPTSSGTK